MMSVHKDSNRIVIDGYNSLTAAIFSEDRICIEVDDESAGDTETGFGATARIYLSPEEAIELGSWLIQAGMTAGKGGAA